ncbi:hypothetical protein D3C78_1533240 [compost metagenome]
MSLAPARLRTNSLLLSWVSRFCTRAVIAVWVTQRRSAAATKLPQRTISMKVRASSISMKASGEGGSVWRRALASLRAAYSVLEAWQGPGYRRLRSA